MAIFIPSRRSGSNPNCGLKRLAEQYRPAIDWREIVSSAQAIVLTGSGSSFFVGKCIADALQKGASIPVTTVESGEILMLGAGALPSVRPLLLVSFSRSGDSPESSGLVRILPG